MSLPEQGKLKSGITFRWLENGSTVAPCDRCHRRVFPDRPRLQVHDKNGPQRKGGKGSRSSYICERCAYRYHLLQPPTVWTTPPTKQPPSIQEGLFNG